MLKYEKEKEKKAFKAMTFREKMTHIRNYYMLHIVAIIIIIAIAAWALNYYVINPPKTASLSIITMSDAGLNLDTTEFQQLLNEQLPELCTERQEVQVQAMSMINDDYQTGYYNSQKLVALVASQSVDLLIGPLELMESYAGADYFYHLDEFFTEEELSTMETVSCEIGNGRIWQSHFGQWSVSAFDIYWEPGDFTVPVWSQSGTLYRNCRKCTKSGIC